MVITRKRKNRQRIYTRNHACNGELCAILDQIETAPASMPAQEIEKRREDVFILP